MKKRILAWLLSAALCMGAAGGFSAAAADKTGVVTLKAAKEGEAVAVTLAVNNLKMNVLQIYVAYDKTRLTPCDTEGKAVSDAAGMTEYLQPEFDPLFGTGWMQPDAVIDAENGVVRYVVIADPAAAGQGTLDEEGYLSVDESGMELLKMRFAVKDGAALYADSIKLGKSKGAPSGIVIATDDEDGIEHTDAVTVDLRAVAAAGNTPGGTGEGYFGKKPDADDGSGSGGGGTGGNSGGTSGSGGTQQPDGAQKPALTDIGSHWARTYIEKLVADGAVNGYEDGTFRPESPLTRGEFAAVLARAMDLETPAGENAFADCAGHWSAKYVNAAFRAGFVNGTGSGAFSPDQHITREEIVTIIARANKLAAGKALTFSDSAAVSRWAADSVSAAVEEGIVSGYPDGTFRPQAQVTRGEMAKMVVAMRG